MARPFTQRAVQSLPQAIPQEPQVITLWDAPKGVNSREPQSRLDPSYAVTLENVIVDQMRICSRFGTQTYGTSFTATPMLVVNFIQSTGTSNVIRFDTDKIWLWTGTAWSQFTGAGPFTGDVNNQWTFTAWNDTLIVSNGKDGTYTLNVGAVTVTAIAAAPAARHLTTWAGRIVATGTLETLVYYGNRVRWSVKNDSTNWTGTGSGYEDMLSTPGGTIDMAMAFCPVTDSAAMIVRSNSVWQVSQTGNADAPFSFSRLYDSLGCRARNSISTVPDGVVFHGLDGVYVVTLSGYKNISQTVRDNFQQNVYDSSRSYGVYNAIRRVYTVAVAETSVGACNATWEYDFATEAWTRQVYPFNIRSIGTTLYSVSSSIDALAGTIDALSGIIDTLGQTDTGKGMFLVPSDTTSYVVLADAGVYTDANIGSNTVNLLLNTGQIKVASPLKRTQVVELQLEYESDTSQTLYFDYMEDGSTSYTNFSSVAITATTKPTILRVNKTLERSFLRFQIRSSTLGKLTVIAFHIFIEEGGMIYS